MKITWQSCLRIAATIALLLLGVYYWQGALDLVGVFISAASPLAVGAVIAYIVNILMSFYERHIAPKSKAKLWVKLRRPACMLLAFVTVVLAVYLIMALIIPQIVSAFRVLLAALPGALKSLYAWLEERFAISTWLEGASFTLPATEADWRSLLEKVGGLLISGVGGVMNAAVTVTSSVVSSVVTIFMALIFCVNILLAKEKLQSQFSRLLRKVCSEGVIARICHVLHVVNGCFHSYIVGQCVEALILGGLCALGMLVLRLPYAVMIGVLVGVLALIPIAGAYIAAAIGAIMIFSVSPIQALIFLVFLVVLQQIEGNLIYPHTVGSSLGLPGIWVLAAVLIGGGVMGIGGMIVFVPLTAAAYKLLGQWVRSEKIGG